MDRVMYDEQFLEVPALWPRARLKSMLAFVSDIETRNDGWFGNG